LARDCKLSRGRLLCLLDEYTQYYHPLPDRDVDCPGDSVSPCGAKLPQPALEVLDGIAGQSIEADLLDQFGRTRRAGISGRAAISPSTTAPSATTVHGMNSHYRKKAMNPRHSRCHDLRSLSTQRQISIVLAAERINELQ